MRQLVPKLSAFQLLRAMSLALLGALCALGHAPAHLPLASLVALTIAAATLLDMNCWKRAMFSAWLFATGYFAVSLSWLVEPFLINAARHLWMAPFALFGLAGGLGLFWTAAFGLAHRLGSGLPSRSALLVGFITFAEFARSEVLTGFPWGLLAYIWSETPIMQHAALGGPYALTALTVLLSVSPLILKSAWQGLAIATAAVGILWMGGVWRVDTEYAAQPDAPTVRIVQPNVPQALKWKRQHQREFFERLLDLTAGDGSGLSPQLVIWPETSATFLPEHESGRFAQMVAAGDGATLAFGIRSRNDAGHSFNSMLVLGPDEAPIAHYDKYRLVPFGEYLPLGKWLERWGLRGLAQQGFSGFRPGSGPELIEIPGIGPVLPLICYEAIFPRGMSAAGRPRALVQITNDAWFGAYSGPQQHLMQARMRSIEHGIPLLRSANTGISAVIDSYGRIVDRLALDSAGFIDAALPPALKPTTYSRTGDWPALLLCLLLVAGGVASGLRNQVQKDERDSSA